MLVRQIWRWPPAQSSKAVQRGRADALLPEGAVFQPSAAQDRHRPVAQLFGSEGCRSRTRSCEVSFGQRDYTREQPGREQPPTDPQAQAPDARFS